MNPTVPSLFDNRARAYVKLHDVDKALEDAERLLRLAPTSALGFIRVGRLRWIKGDKEKAQEVFGKGLQGVGPTEARYNELLTCWEEVTRVPDKGIKRKSKEDKQDAKRIELDPLIGILPVELLGAIFAYLPLKDLSKTARTCKHWRDVGKQWKLLWCKLDLSPYSRKINNQQIGHLIARASHRLVKLDLGENALVDDHVLRQLMSYRCNSLAQLRMAGNKKMSRQILAKAFQIIGPSLTHLSLPGITNFDDLCLESVLKHCKQLQLLDISGTATTSRCFYNKASLAPLKQFVGNSQTHTDRTSQDVSDLFHGTLESFELTGCTGMTSASLGSFATATKLKNINMWQCPLPVGIPMAIVLPNLKLVNLKSLRFSHAPSFDDNSFAEFIHRHQTLTKVELALSNVAQETLLAVFSLPDLTHLRLESCQRMFLTPIFQRIESGNLKLKSFVMTNNPHLTDNDLSMFARHAPDLTELDVSNCPQITTTGVFHLVNKVDQKLQRVNLNGCHRVGTGAVQALRNVVGTNGIVSARMDI